MGTFDLKPRIEVQQKKKQQKEHKLIGSMKHQKGLTLFSINTKTGEIKPAEYLKESTITFEQALLMLHEGNITRKLVIEKDCIYLEALNVENARKKYLKSL